MALRLADYLVMKNRIMGQHYVMMPHILTMCTALEKCMAGTLPNGAKNLIINIPPRHSKSSTVEAFVELYSGYLPDSEWLYASCTSDIASKSTSRIQKVMNQPWYRQAFPDYKTDFKCMSQILNFTNTAGGGVYGCGVDGSMIGVGAGKLREGFGGAFIIDDIIKQKDGHSAKMRDDCKLFFDETVTTRFNSNWTPTILIMQRVHPNDLTGYVQEQAPEDWYVVKIPAYDTVNKTALWEDRISAKELEKMREVSPFKFHAQYQQHPINVTGSVIKAIWWNYYNNRDDIIKRSSYMIMTADTAYKAKEASDYTVFQVWAFEGTKRAYLVDQLRIKAEFPEMLIMAQAFWDKWQNMYIDKKPRTMFVEDRASGQSLIQTLARTLGDCVQPWLPKEFEAPDDKWSKALEMAYLVHAGAVWLPNPDTVEGTTWIDTDYLTEWAEFREDNGHRHDDQIDASTMAVLTWRSMGGGYTPK